MAVHSHIHFCLIGCAAPTVKSGAHPDLVDTIDVTMNIGDASVTISGSSADVRSALSEMLGAALRVVPVPAADASKTPSVQP